MRPIEIKGYNLSDSMNTGIRATGADDSNGSAGYLLQGIFQRFLDSEPAGRLALKPNISRAIIFDTGPIAPCSQTLYSPSTNIRRAISALSPGRRPSLTIRVYPPGRLA